MRVFTESALRDITPPDLDGYLRARGWVPRSVAGGLASSWLLVQKPSDADEFDAEDDDFEPSEHRWEILVPHETTVRDYVTRLAQGMSVLQRVEKRPWLNIVRDILLSGADVVRLQVKGASNALRLEDGRSVVDRLSDLMTAAACSAVVPRAVVPSRRPPQALDYLSRVRMGHTEEGSFVFTAISRVEPQLTPGTPGLEEFWSDPFPRKVTEKLVEGLAALTLADAEVNKGKSYDAFTELISSGVSANLCEAVAGMLVTNDMPHDIGISVAWATTIPKEQLSSPSFSFDPSMVLTLRQGAARLRAIEPIAMTPVAGIVERLARPEDSEAGVVTVRAAVEGKVRALRVELPPADYQRAVVAHHDKVPVFFTATIEKRGRGFEAKGVADFRILDSQKP